MMSALQRIMLILRRNKPRRQIELKLKQKGVDADIISRFVMNSMKIIVI